MSLQATTSGWTRLFGVDCPQARELLAVTKIPQAMAHITARWSRFWRKYVIAAPCPSYSTSDLEVVTDCRRYRERALRIMRSGYHVVSMEDQERVSGFDPRIIVPKWRAPSGTANFSSIYLIGMKRTVLSLVAAIALCVSSLVIAAPAMASGAPAKHPAVRRVG